MRAHDKHCPITSAWRLHYLITMSNYTVQLQARRMQCPLSAQIGLMAITVENFLIGLINLIG